MMDKQATQAGVGSLTAAAPNIRCSRPGMSWAVCVWNAPGG